MTTPTIPYYPITHDDGLDIVDALEAIKNAISADQVWGSITGTLSDQTDLQNALNTKADLANEIMYFYQQTVNAATNAQIMRIPSSGTNSAITTDTVVLDCTFAAPANITSNVSWTSYSGYIAFTGTCTVGTTANVTLGKKGN